MILPYSLYKKEGEMRVRSLEKRSVDSLISQMFAAIGGELRIVGPDGSLSASDERYVGILRRLLLDFVPGIPEEVLATVRENLIVVARATETASALVGFTPSTLRLSRDHWHKADKLQAKYGPLLNVTVQRGNYLETDFEDARLVFGEDFFVNRSTKGWARLSTYFARLCSSMQELRSQSGVREVSHSGRDTTLVPAEFVSRQGEELQLV